jgi:uncharacterized membrane protein
MDMEIDMNKVTTNGLLSAAFAGALAAGTILAAEPASAESKVKCYGVAKAGQNDCASADGSHSCAGQASKDYDAKEWKYVEKTECIEMGGGTTPDEAMKNPGPEA